MSLWSLCIQLALLFTLTNAQFRCLRREGNNPSGLGAISTVTCEPGEVMVSCGVDSNVAIGGTRIVNVTGEFECWAQKDQNSGQFTANAVCCPFSDGLVLDVFTNQTSGNGIVTSTCPDTHELTACMVWRDDLNYNTLFGSYADNSPGPVPPLETADWTDTQNICTGQSKLDNGALIVSAQCVQFLPDFGLICTTKAEWTRDNNNNGLGGQEADNDANCANQPGDTFLVHCGQWTNQTDADVQRYYVDGAEDPKCFAHWGPAGNGHFGYHNAICCEFKDTPAPTRSPTVVPTMATFSPTFDPTIGLWLTKPQQLHGPNVGDDDTNQVNVHEEGYMLDVPSMYFWIIWGIVTCVLLSLFLIMCKQVCIQDQSAYDTLSML